MTRSFALKSIHGPDVTGEAVVLTGGFSPRYHLNRERGVFSLPGHELDGKSPQGKILICDFARGGIAGGWSLNDLKHKEFVPKALVFVRANPVMVQGSIFAGITIAEGLSEEDFELLKTAKYVQLVAENKKLIMVEKNSRRLTV